MNPNNNLILFSIMLSSIAVLFESILCISNGLEDISKKKIKYGIFLISIGAISIIYCLYTVISLWII